MADSAEDAERQAVVSSGLLRRSNNVDVDYNPAFDLQCSGWDTENDVRIPAKKRLSLTLKKVVIIALIRIQHQSDKNTAPAFAVPCCIDPPTLKWYISCIFCPFLKGIYLKDFWHYYLNSPIYTMDSNPDTNLLV